MKPRTRIPLVPRLNGIILATTFADKILQLDIQPLQMGSAYDDVA